MYESHWRLQRPPFENTADPSFYYPAPTHQGALLKLQYAIERTKGLALICGEHGGGKTFLTHVLERDLDPARYIIRRLVYPHLSADELLAYLVRASGGDSTEPALRRDALLHAFEGTLRRLAGEGRHLVLIVDEAHLLETQHLQALQSILNYQQQPGMQLSLILAGQPELLPRVRRVGGLESRLAVRTTLKSLSAEECLGYVRHRLEVAGCPDLSLHDATIATIHDLSLGVPRRINQLCDLALLIGFADERTSLSEVDVHAAAEELNLVSSE